MSNTELKLNDLLAIDRTRLAAERSLMAWIRTALSMIIFGFSIYKVLQALQERGAATVLQPHAPRNAGLVLIGIGTFALVIACVQHWKYVRKLGAVKPSSPGTWRSTWPACSRFWACSCSKASFSTPVPSADRHMTTSLSPTRVFSNDAVSSFNPGLARRTAEAPRL